MNKRELAFILAFFFFGMILGLVVGGSIMATDHQYQESAIMTCDYANKITNVLNDQSETLKLYTTTDYTYLDQLNCSKLRS